MADKLLLDPLAPDYLDLQNGGPDDLLLDTSGTLANFITLEDAQLLTPNLSPPRILTPNLDSPLLRPE